MSAESGPYGSPSTIRPQEQRDQSHLAETVGGFRTRHERHDRNLFLVDALLAKKLKRERERTTSQQVREFVGDIE